MKTECCCRHAWSWRRGVQGPWDFPHSLKQTTLLGPEGATECRVYPPLYVSSIALLRTLQDFSASLNSSFSHISLSSP